MVKRFLEMAMRFLEDKFPEWRKELCDYSDEYSAKTDNEWDDYMSRVLRFALGVPK